VHDRAAGGSPVALYQRDIRGLEFRVVVEQSIQGEYLAEVTEFASHGMTVRDIVHLLFHRVQAAAPIFGIRTNIYAGTEEFQVRIV
jgi:hypothetical protein